MQDVKDGMTVEVVEVSSGAALAKSAPRTLLDRAAAGSADLSQTLERYAKGYQTLRMLCLQSTGIKDWTISGSDGKEVAQITSSGARVLFPILGVSYEFSPVDQFGNPAPIRLAHPTREGVFGFELNYCAQSRLLGLENLRGKGARWSDEEFAGRIDLPRDQRRNREARDSGQSMSTDLESAVISLCLRKIAGDCGFGKISLADLQDAWAGTKKRVEQIDRGAGGGSSTDRKAAALSTDSVKIEQALLFDAIGRAVGGDEEAGKKLCRELTEWTDKTSGKKNSFDVPTRLTRDFQFEQAWKRFAEHPTFGKACPSAAERDSERARLAAEGGVK